MTLTQTCDRCGPAVSAAVTVEGGLTFCAHHARAYKLPLINTVELYDAATGYVIDNFKVPDARAESTGACTADPDFPVDAI